MDSSVPCAVFTGDADLLRACSPKFSKALRANASLPHGPILALPYRRKWMESVLPFPSISWRRKDHSQVCDIFWEISLTLRHSGGVFVESVMCLPSLAESVVEFAVTVGLSEKPSRMYPPVQYSQAGNSGVKIDLTFAEAHSQGTQLSPIFEMNKPGLCNLELCDGV